MPAGLITSDARAAWNVDNQKRASNCFLITCSMS